MFEDITKDWLVEFENFLAQTNTKMHGIFICAIFVQYSTMLKSGNFLQNPPNIRQTNENGDNIQGQNMTIQGSDTSDFLAVIKQQQEQCCNYLLLML